MVAWCCGRVVAALAHERRRFGSNLTRGEADLVRSLPNEAWTFVVRSFGRACFRLRRQGRSRNNDIHSAQADEARPANHGPERARISCQSDASELW